MPRETGRRNENRGVTAAEVTRAAPLSRLNAMLPDAGSRAPEAESAVTVSPGSTPLEPPLGGTRFLTNRYDKPSA